MAISDEARTEFERSLTGGFAGATAGLAAAILDALGDPPNADGVPDSLWLGAEAGLTAALVPSLMQIYLASAVDMATANGITPDMAALTNTATAWAESYSFELVKGITNTSRDRLRELVTAFLKDDKQDLKTLGGKIADMFGPVRGDMIAITEVTRASAEGQRGLLQILTADNPAIKGAQIWRTSRDELVCPICRRLNNVLANRRGLFEHPETGQVFFPPAHPRCRCAVSVEILQ